MSSGHGEICQVQQLGHADCKAEGKGGEG